MTSIRTIRLDFNLMDKYLIVVATGESNSYKELLDITNQIYSKVVETRVKFILLDFQYVHLKMDWTDSFNLVRIYEKSMPVFTEILVCCTFNPDSEKFAKYWQEICQKRGFKVCLYPSRFEAEKRLIEKLNQYRSFF